MRSRTFIISLAIFIFVIFFIFVLYSYKSSTSTIPPPSAEFFHSKGKIGHNTWTFMHSILANLECGGDDKLSPEIKDRAIELIHAVQKNFPCPACRQDFGQLLSQYPTTDIITKTALNEWLCNLHNLVNKKLNKEQFNCDILESKYKLRVGS
jgi:hypothetical protein